MALGVVRAKALAVAFSVAVVMTPAVASPGARATGWDPVGCRLRPEVQQPNPHQLKDERTLGKDYFRVRHWGQTHAAGTFVDVRFQESDPTCLVAEFTDDIPARLADLRRVVDHPERLAVAWVPYSRPRLAFVRDEIERRYFNGPDSPLAELGGGGGGPVDVVVLAGHADVAADLVARYGSAVRVRLGEFAYPPSRAHEVPNCGTAIPAGPDVRSVPGIEVRFLPKRWSVRTGDFLPGQIVVTNHGNTAFTFGYSSPATAGVSRAGDLAVIGTFEGPLAGVGWAADLQPGRTVNLPALVGTASCSLSIGYSLPPGEYDVQAAVPVMKDRNTEAYFLAVPPVTITLTR